MDNNEEPYPRIRELPEQERQPFEEWLCGQTRPYVNGVCESDQDFYFPWDYNRWIANRKK